jgi:hypothetical protein
VAAETVPSPAPDEKPKPFSLWRLIKGLAVTVFIVGIVGWMGVGCVTCLVHETGCRSFDREVQVRWRARVRSSAGINLPEGTPCSVDATFWTSPGERTVEGVEVKATCAGSVVFEGDSTRPSVSLQQERAPGGWRYRLITYSQTSDEDDHVTFTTNGSTAWIRRSGRPGGWVIELPFDRWSEPSRGDPAFAPAPPPRDPGFDETVQRLGAVRHVSGAPPVRVGDSCLLRVRPIRTPDHNCRVHLSCSGRVLYDSHTGCSVEVRAPVRASDRPEQGTALDLDLPAGTVKVFGRPPGLPYSADVALAP